MRVFLDTNILVSAAISSGLCRYVVRLVNRKHQMVVSRLVLQELDDVLRNKLNATDDTLQWAELLLAGAEVAHPPDASNSTGISNDLVIVQTAAAAEVDVLVTGDLRMRGRASDHGLLSMSPRGFLELIIPPKGAYPRPADDDSGPLVSESQENPIKEKSFTFALEIVKLYQHLQDQDEYVLSKQLLRAGTSIGANIEEATAAESRRDFHHKLAIASKEARETNYWLRLLLESGIAKSTEIDPLLDASDELVRMLTAIVKTTSRRQSQ